MVAGLLEGMRRDARKPDLLVPFLDGSCKRQQVYVCTTLAPL
jgi:hypothetical protein